jgi:peptidoglycan/LPS O-acetylase OafA/YrhL
VPPAGLTAGHRRRIDVLDGIRGLAIGLVVAFHAGFAPGGGIGVTLFFVLSGYLITGILIKPGILSRAGLGRFWLRRLLRLFPALLAVCLFCTAWALVVVSGHARHLLLSEIATSLTYTQDFYLGHGRSTADFGYLGQTWSLAIEQQFYLLWPVILLAILRFSKSWRTQVAATLLFALVITAWRAHLAGQGLNAHVGLNIDAQGDSLLVGCALALAMPHIRGAAAGRQTALDIGAWGGLAAIAAFGLGDINRITPGRTGYLMISLCTAVLILRLLTEPATRPSRLLERLFSFRPLVWLGLISYSLYLWHPVIFKIASDDIGIRTLPQKVASAPILGAVILLISWASYRWIELPFQRLRNSRMPDTGPSVAAVPDAPLTASLRADRAPVTAARPAPDVAAGRAAATG